MISNGLILLTVSLVVLLSSPVALIVTVVSLAGLWRMSNTPSLRSGWRIVGRILLLLLPMLPTMLIWLCLQWMAERANVLLGHWPRVMADDPKIVCCGDPAFDRLDNLMDYWLLPFNAASLLIWVWLAVRLRLQIPRWFYGAALVALIAAWSALFIGGGRLFDWWLD